MFISCVSCIADRFFTAELSEKPSKREGRENTLSQNRSPSRGFANEGQTCARMSSRLRTLFFTLKKNCGEIYNKTCHRTIFNHTVQWH